MVEVCVIFGRLFLVCHCYSNKCTDHARVHAGLWDTLGQKEAGSIATGPGGLDGLLHVVLRACR